MKKTFLALSLLLSATFAFAEVTYKTVADAEKGLAKAKSATEDAKKALKPATWISYADALVGAYNQPLHNVLVGTPANEMKMILREQKILSTTNEKAAGSDYVVDHYADKDLFYNAAGVLEFYVITKPAVEGNLLTDAQNALLKASELDVKASKKEEITKKMESIHDCMFNEALGYYYIGKYELAAKSFKEAVECYATPVLGKLDTMNCYHTALVSASAGDRATAIEYYSKCIENNYYQEGNVFSNLSAIYMAEGDTLKGKQVLEDGFGKYPQSQGVLVGLINLYRSTGEDPQHLFDLLHTAQANEPTNASLFYVEGDIYKQMKDYENAEKFFYKATEIDPTYVYGVLSVGVMYYEKAVDIQTKASEELDDAKYTALMKEFEASLEKALEPFEQSYANSNDPEIKTAVAEYLKNIYFRFRSKGDSYQQAYEKYNAIMNAAK